MNAYDGIRKSHEKGFKRRVAGRQAPQLFDRQWWKTQEVWQTLMKLNIPKDKSILDVGCLSGEILANLWEAGYARLCGVDIVEEAIDKAIGHRHQVGGKYPLVRGFFEDIVLQDSEEFDYILVSDCLEHVHNIGYFFASMLRHGTKDFTGILIVPKGTNFCDECHVNFWPTVRGFNNLLDHHFKIESSWESKDRITAIVRRK